MCGENHFLCRIARTKRGSPRACGENRIVELFGSQQNESPPCVGKTVVTPPFFNRGKNHPRACREIPQLFYVLSLSHYLSEISDSISTSVFSIFKTKQKVIRVNRRESTHEMTGVEPVSKYRKIAHIREFMLRV